jgi:hypothetical protein
MRVVRLLAGALFMSISIRGASAAHGSEVGMEGCNKLGCPLV